MNSGIFKFLKDYSSTPITVDRLIVSSYIRINQIRIEQNELIKTYFIEDDKESKENKALLSFVSLILKEKENINLEDLIRLFEFVISPAEKEVNGAIYTPAYIREYIIRQILSKKTDQQLYTTTFADISCGCGGFFFTLVNEIKKRINTTCEEIFKTNIYGVDIQPYSIRRTELLLTLLAITYGEDIPEFSFNLFVGNSLSFNWGKNEVIAHNGGFDVVIGNPPYVSSSKIDKESKELLKNWSVTKTGKPDLYIPFFQIGIENLRPDGILGYITVNNFYRSLNGRALREYFSGRNDSLTMIDFGSEQVFKGRSTYTCICFIQNDQAGQIRYIKTPSSKLNDIQEKDFIQLQYNVLSNQNGWHLKEISIATLLNQIEATGIPLGHQFNIRNGFATLKNDIYLFTPIEENELLYSFIKNGKTYQVEKNICRDAIKPNTLKTEHEITLKMEKLIFPYQFDFTLFGAGDPPRLIHENELRKTYPLTYNYLSDFKEDLAKRDKGTREYEVWYAFGRSQAINIRGYKLLFPYISDRPYFVYTQQEDLLFYNGYALVSDNREDLLVAQKVLSSDLFWFYVRHTSKPYGSEYYALAKNYVKNFGMYPFTQEQRERLLQMTDKEDINQYLCQLYEIDIN